jgi:hypothetical protein
MTPFRHRQSTPGLLLGAALLGALLYLYGLATTMQFGDASAPGMLLVPDLPTPLYFVMGCVMCAGVGLTILASIRQRRRHAELQAQHQEETVRTTWQTTVSMLSTMALLIFAAIWLIRHGHVLERLRSEAARAHEFFGAGTQSLVQQMQSPTAGYAMFTVVILVYGGIGLLGLWLLFEGWGRGRFLNALTDDSQPRRVQRAVAAGLQELRLHTDPRQAIIACYARLEHLLTDYGVPAHAHLTPQEYMHTALHDLDLPTDAFAGLVALFELARYSLHPLDETARATAMAHLEQVQAHLTQDHLHATPA